MLGEKSAQEGREARLSSLKALFWGGGSPGIGAGSQTMRSFPMRYTRGGRMLLEWATFRAWSGFRQTHMGNPG